MDIATPTNLESLVRIGEKLLKKPIAKVNFETGAFDPSTWGTNERALIRYKYIDFINSSQLFTVSGCFMTRSNCVYMANYTKFMPAD